jgi:hypothetical protein
MCEDVPYISAAAELYRDGPIYVANEMPTDELRAWASMKPGFEEIWIDRQHGGWVTLAFSVDAAARQLELEQEFPDVGVVAVQVDWTLDELQALQRRVASELMPELTTSTGIPSNKGVVTIGIGVMTPERLAAVEEAFAGERVCLEGIDPADAPAQGPQQQAGDGWRLVADQDEVGSPYRTGIGFDEESYERLWAEARLRGERPAVDFEWEVVIWFGAVHGSSCPNLRLDGVMVDLESSIIHADIVNLDMAMVCTADAIGHAYVVALERAKLPVGAFAIQLNADGPPPGAPEERTLVDVDLSKPGSVAEAGQVHGDPNLPEPFFLEPGDFLEPGFPMPYRQSVHCGVEWLGPLNEFSWRTEVAAGSVDYIPSEWRSSVGDGSIELEVLLSIDPEPSITATANDHAVVYRATADQPPGCD